MGSVNGREERRMQKSKQEKEQPQRTEERGQRKYKEENYAPCSFSLSTGEIPVMSQILACSFFRYGQGSLYCVPLAYWPPAEHCSEDWWAILSLPLIFFSSYKHLLFLLSSFPSLCISNVSTNASFFFPDSGGFTAMTEQPTDKIHWFLIWTTLVICSPNISWPHSVIFGYLQFSDVPKHLSTSFCLWYWLGCCPLDV